MSATYIYQHTSGYIFRYCIPPDFQPQIKKKELRYSLKTGSLRCAKARASDMMSFIRSVINDIRVCSSDTVTATQIDSLIKNKLQQVTYQNHRTTSLAELPAISPPRSAASGTKLSEVLDRYVADAKKAKQWSPKTTSVSFFLFGC